MKFLTFLARRHTLLAALALALAIPLGAWLGTAFIQVVQFEADRESDAASLFDTEGRLIATVGNRRQAFVPLSEIPVSMQHAIVAIEDSRFYQHFGLDLRGIARAVWTDIKAGGKVQGASTLTQQLARTLFLSPEKTIVRKLQEAVLALILEMRYSKPRILEIYLNSIYYGEGAYGIGEAALTYFAKPVSQLTLAESALLAALPKAPSTLSPYREPQRAIERRNLVLSRMAEQGYITTAQAEEASKEPLELARRRGGQAPYFADYVTAQLIDQFGSTTVYRGGLRVVTTLDLDTQAAAQDALGDNQGAIVALDPRSGAIRAMVGGRDYVESQFNRATQAHRQPGSAFKPFVYATALEQGLPMNHVLWDYPQDFNGYHPENFKGQYWGQVTMKQALVRSLNTATVRLLQQVGVANVISMAQRLGITTLQLPDDRNLALALGGLTKGVTPLEMAAAYAPFANQGIKHAPYAIEQVVDRNGRILFRHRPQPQRVLSPETAYLITNMLQAAVERGTGTAAAIGRPQAGKTGTTNDTLSAWFVGYTPQLVAAVYVGHDKRQPLNGGGGSIAAPIWGKFAQQALKDEPVEGFVVPPNIQTNIPVDVFTGLLASSRCRLQELDAFVAGTVPTQPAPCYWNAAAQPLPPDATQQPPRSPEDLAALPGGLFGDDPVEPVVPLPASFVNPLGSPVFPLLPPAELTEPSPQALPLLQQSEDTSSP